MLDERNMLNQDPRCALWSAPALQHLRLLPCPASLHCRTAMLHVALRLALATHCLPPRLPPRLPHSIRRAPPVQAHQAPVGEGAVWTSLPAPSCLWPSPNHLIKRLFLVLSILLFIVQAHQEAVGEGAGGRGA